MQIGDVALVKGGNSPDTKLQISSFGCAPTSNRIDCNATLPTHKDSGCRGVQALFQLAVPDIFFKNLPLENAECKQCSYALNNDGLAHQERGCNLVGR